MFAELVGQAPDWLQPYLDKDGPILSVVTLLIIWISYKISRTLLQKYLKQRAYKEENVQHFLFIWRYVWMGIGVVFGLISFSGSLSTLGLSAAFLGMILGWSLQAPVTGIAAWLMIILKQPFKIGDRVIIAGIIGDVVDINLTHVILNQVGGTVGGEERSGRAVLIPNATLFGQIIYNYTLEGARGPEAQETTSSYILDEVPVRVTFQSDFAEVEKILIAAAQQVTAEIISETKEEPFIRAELFESGIMVRLRYKTLAKDRQRISSEIVQIIIGEFGKNNRTNFCYPHMNLYYGSNDQLSGPATPTVQGVS